MKARIVAVVAILISFGLIVVYASDAADARQIKKECQWFGEGPLCDGKCPAGWKLIEYGSKGCIGTWGVSGTRALCCKITAEDKPCGPAQYGTEGCPYPKFGGEDWIPDSKRKKPKKPPPSAELRTPMPR